MPSAFPKRCDDIAANAPARTTPVRATLLEEIALKWCSNIEYNCSRNEYNRFDGSSIWSHARGSTGVALWPSGPIFLYAGDRTASGCERWRNSTRTRKPLQSRIDSAAVCTCFGKRNAAGPDDALSRAGCKLLPLNSPNADKPRFARGWGGACIYFISCSSRVPRNRRRFTTMNAKLVICSVLINCLFIQ